MVFGNSYFVMLQKAYFPCKFKIERIKLGFKPLNPNGLSRLLLNCQTCWNPILTLLLILNY